MQKEWAFIWDQERLSNFIRLKVTKNSFYLYWFARVKECTIFDPFCKNDYGSFWLQMILTSERASERALLQGFSTVINILSFDGDKVVGYWLEDPFFFYDSGGNGNFIFLCRTYTVGVCMHMHVHMFYCLAYRYVSASVGIWASDGFAF